MVKEVKGFKPNKLRGKAGTDVRKTVCEALRKGHRREQAFIRAGVAPSTMHGWLRHYREEVEDGLEDTVLINFFREVLQAEADAEADIVEILRNSAMDGNIKSSMYILDKRYGWAGKQEVELSAKDDNKIEIEIVGMTNPHEEESDEGRSGDDSDSREVD